MRYVSESCGCKDESEGDVGLRLAADDFLVTHILSHCGLLVNWRVRYIRNIKKSNVVNTLNRPSLGLCLKVEYLDVLALCLGQSSTFFGLRKFTSETSGLHFLCALPTLTPSSFLIGLLGARLFVRTLDHRQLNWNNFPSSAQHAICS